MKSIYLISGKTGSISEFTLKGIAPVEREIIIAKVFFSNIKKTTTTHSLFGLGLLFAMFLLLQGLLSNIL